LSGVICAVSIARTPELRFGREHLRRDRALTRRLLALGLPVALQNTVISVGGVVVQTIVNGYDVAFIAGFTATNKLYGLLEIAALSYGYAVTTYVGQNFGARRADRVRAGMRAGVLLSLVTAAVIAGAMILWGRQATMLFLSSEDPAVELAAGRTAYRYLVIMSAALPVLYLLYLYRAALQGMGDTVIPMVSGIVEFVMRVGVAVIVFFTGHRNNIFFSEVTAWIGAALLLGIAYYVSAARLARRPEFRPPAAPGEI
ncbi:MAG: MATE family efflux transporter, partial [Oscillospiraceae bacterium]|nr:MATE family efflux transporter [Oscillospiraceae bacterium]